MSDDDVVEAEYEDVPEPPLHREPIPEIRALVPVQPGQVLVTDAADPNAMVEAATRLANALKNIVDRQGLFTMIQGRKYPQVEAWATIGRLDNVVAMEARPPVRNEDGSYEAYVNLVRLSDGMVVGSASALCGAPDDEPWGGTKAKQGRPAQGPRPEHQRRSMAVTRATSRAFRQQYSWIMTLAGYEATPADEMPREDAHSASGTAQERSNAPQGQDVGHATFTGAQESFSGDINKEPDGIRRTPDGLPVLEVRFKVGRSQHTAFLEGNLAEWGAAYLHENMPVTIVGVLHLVTWDPDKPKKKEVRDVESITVGTGRDAVRIDAIRTGGASADPPPKAPDPAPTQETAASGGSDGLFDLEPNRATGKPGTAADVTGRVDDITWETVPSSGNQFVLVKLLDDEGLMWHFAFGGDVVSQVLRNDGEQRTFRYHAGDQIRCTGTWAKQRVVATMAVRV